MKRLLVLPHAGALLTQQPAVDLRSQWKDLRAAEAALQLGLLLGETGLDPAAVLAVVVPWTAAAAHVLRALQSGHAGAWQLDLMAEPEPTTLADSTAWRDLRLAAAASKADAEIMLDPLQRLLEVRQAQVAEKAVVQPTKSAGPDHVVTEALRMREFPDEVRRRLGLTAENFGEWVRQHAADVTRALLHRDALPPPRVVQAWETLLPDGALLGKPAPADALPATPAVAPSARDPMLALVSELRGGAGASPLRPSPKASAPAVDDELDDLSLDGDA